MRRSAVLSGRQTQRDRAQLRGRLDGRKAQSQVPAKDELITWLQTSIHVDDVSDIETLNLNDFLRNTGQINLTVDERLRQLAIFLEPSLSTPQPRAWLALDRVYTHAVTLAPESLWLHHSRGLSAKFCAEGLYQPNEATTLRRILNAAWDAGNKAHSIDSAEPDVLYLLGSLAYIDADRTLDESLNFFDSAIANEPKHQWSLLYRAHCLQDLERWPDAAVAYDNVDPAYFVGPLAWRYELLLEQKAYCIFQSGDQPKAIEQFHKLLNRWITDPKLGFGMTGIHLSEVATSEFHDQLSARYNELVRHEDWAWLANINSAPVLAEQTDEPECSN